MDKKELRRAMAAQKRAMTAREIELCSADLCRQLFETDLWKNAESVYAYVSYNQEVRTQAILERALQEGKRLAVPKLYGPEMRFIRIGDLSQLAPGAFSIPEPVQDEPVAEDETALVLMPGLAFDRQGHRLGYGGGYYDRYLAEHPGHPTAALCYGFQMLEQLDVEDYDVPVDLVLWSDAGEAEV